MYYYRHQFILTFFFGIVVAVNAKQALELVNHDGEVHCYYDASAYSFNGRAKFLFEDLDTSMCSHLLYYAANVNVENATIDSTIPSLDLDPPTGLGYYKKVASLKSKHPELIILIVLTPVDDSLSVISADPSQRTHFITNLIIFLRENNFSGVDIYWDSLESIEDSRNYVLLLMEMKHRFQPLKYKIAIEINGFLHNIKNFDLPNMNKYADIIYLYASNYHGNYESYTAAMAPLQSSDPSDPHTVKKSLGFVLDRIESDKIVLTFSNFGRQYTIIANESSGKLGEPTEDNTFVSPYTNNEYLFMYNEICHTKLSGTWHEYWDNVTSTPVITSRKFVISFENSRSIIEKVKYALKFGIKKFASWAINYDDFRGDCGERYPLLKSIHKGIKQTEENHLKPNLTLNDLKETYQLNNIVEVLNQGKVAGCFLDLNSSYYPGDGTFTIENVDPNLCTHLIYDGAKINLKYFTLESRYPDLDLSKNNGPDYIEKLRVMKSDYPHLKVMLSIGGNAESKKFPTIFRNKSSIANFAINIENFIKKYDFDGINIYWDQPNPKNMKCMAHLIKELRLNLGSDYIVAISMTQPSLKTVKYNLGLISSDVDFLFFGGFSYHGNWERRTGANAPIYSEKPEDENNLDWTLKSLICNGMPKNKIILGLPFFGRQFILEYDRSNGKFGEYSIGNKIFKGPYSASYNYIQYNEICELLNAGDWKRYWNNITFTPLIANKDWVVSYDDEHSIRGKVHYAMGLELGGVMGWGIHQDDFRGKCNKTKSPLMRAAITEMTYEAHSSHKFDVEVDQSKVDNKVASTQIGEGGKYLYCHWNEFETLSVSDIDPFICTHIVYDTNIVDGEILTQNDTDGRVLVLKSRQLKMKNKSLKILLGIPADLYYLKNPQISYDNLIFYLRSNKLDGVNLIWDSKNINYDVEQNLNLHIQELRAKLNSINFIYSTQFTLSLTVYSSFSDLTKIKIWDTLSKHVDIIVLAYLKEERCQTIKFAAPLNSPDFLNINFTLAYVLNKRVPPKKILLGLPTFGYRVDNSRLFNKSAIKLSSEELCKIKEEVGYEQWDSLAKTPFVTTSNLFVTYENIESFQYKVEFAEQFDLQGVSIFRLSTDDYKGICSNIKFPLVKQAKALLEPFSFTLSVVERTLNV